MDSNNIIKNQPLKHAIKIFLLNKQNKIPKKILKNEVLIAINQNILRKFAELSISNEEIWIFAKQ